MISRPSRTWSNSRFARTALPMFGFVVVAWLGLSQLMESKLRIKSGIRGHDSVEEYDPIERMRRMAGADTAVTSLEQELKELHAKHDIHHFDYKPVPRTDEDDEG